MIYTDQASDQWHHNSIAETRTPPAAIAAYGNQSFNMGREEQK